MLVRIDQNMFLPYLWRNIFINIGWLYFEDKGDLKGYKFNFFPNPWLASVFICHQNEGVQDRTKYTENENKQGN